MQRLTGTPASSGVVRGRWIIVRPAALPAGRVIQGAEVDAELARAAAARAAPGAGRAAAVLDVARRVARILAGIPEAEGLNGRLDAPAIVVAHDLLPSA